MGMGDVIWFGFSSETVQRGDGSVGGNETR